MKPLVRNKTDRIGYCMASRGSLVNEIIFHLLTGMIVLSNKNRNLKKYSVVFLKHFPKKKVFGGPYTWQVVNINHTHGEYTKLQELKTKKSLKFPTNRPLSLCCFGTFSFQKYPTKIPPPHFQYFLINF